MGLIVTSPPVHLCLFEIFSFGRYIYVKNCFQTKIPGGKELSAELEQLSGAHHPGPGVSGAHSQARPLRSRVEGSLTEQTAAPLVEMDTSTLSELLAS